MCVLNARLNSQVSRLFLTITRTRIEVCRCAGIRAGTLFGLALCAGALLVASPAHAIVGGSPSSKPWVVGVIDIENGVLNTVCSGAAISAQLVVTAKHCPASAVVFANRTATIASRHDIPGEGRDTSVLVLTAPHPLTEYPKLSRVEEPLLLPGTEGSVYGYGSVFSEIREQRELKFTVSTSSDGSANLQGDGRMEAGDSGAPWLINGELVGVHHGEEKGNAGSYDFDSIWYALDIIKTLEYQLKAHAVAASDL